MIAGKFASSCVALTLAPAQAFSSLSCRFTCWFANRCPPLSVPISRKYFKGEIRDHKENHLTGPKTMLASTVRREFPVCNEDDLKDDTMQEFELSGGKKILMVKQKRCWSALGPKCTHYGAPLAKGSLSNGRIRCPWHGACFDACNGDIEDFPGLDSLPHFEVVIRDGKVFVVASDSDFQTSTRIKTMCAKDPSNEKTVLIIGGGAAAQTCSETLRQEGFTGNILMATRERNTPYDRPKLSKAMDVDVKSILLRPADFYQKFNIEVLTNKEAKKIDILKKTVAFQDGTALSYDSLLLATGGEPNTLNVPGKNLRNICLLRTPEDAFAIARASHEKHVVIVGSSFIGMEAASFLVEKATSVSVISMTKVPFQFAFGMEIGARFLKLFEENGIKFYNGRTVSEYRGGKNNEVNEIILDDKTVVRAEICVLGVGVHPSTDFVSGSGIPINKNGFLAVDKKMRTEVENVFAAGDIVQFPLFCADDRQVSIAHWQMAHSHGRVAALNILNKNVDIHSVPFFWTVLLKKSLRYAGYGAGYDDIILDGDLEGLQFVAYYTKSDKVIAVASLNSDPVVAKFADLLLSGRTLSKEEIKSDPKKWLE